MIFFQYLFSFLFLTTASWVWAADDFVPADQEIVLLGTSSQSFIIDSANAGGNLQLQFGGTLAEYLQWVDADNMFELSQSLRIAGNLEITETELVFDSDNVGAGSDVRIIANQGSDLPGEIRYNATTNQWEYSNDGGAFEAVGSGGAPVVPQDLPIVQARISTVLAIPATFTNVFFDVTDVENNPSVLDHDDTFRDRILILEDGFYFISYDFSIDNPTANNSSVNVFSRVRVNNATVLNGSESRTSAERRDTDGSDMSQSFVANLTAGDFLSLQFERSATAVDTIPNGIFVVYKLESSLAVAAGGWSDDGATTTTALDVQIDGNLEVEGDIVSPCGPYGIFWAERGAVNSNQSWAMGNGQTPWGSPMGCAGRVTRFAATCTGSIGTSLDAVVRVNNVVTPCSLNLSTTVGQATTVSCNQAFGPNDVVGVYAGTEVGAWTNCVGTFWVRYD